VTTGQIILWGVTIFGAGSIVGAGLAALGIDIYATRNMRHAKETS